MNIFIDGTWNDIEDNTNVLKMYETHGGEYYSGPGTGDNFIDKYLGGVFGYGTDAIVDRILKKLEGCEEEVRIIGFSRGAAAARILAAKWCDKGNKVRFLGCFDTVGAFGIPFNIFGIPFQKINLFHDMHVHKNVQTAAHITALDEHRESFVGTPMEPRKGITSKAVHGDHNYVGSSQNTLKWMDKQWELSRTKVGK